MIQQPPSEQELRQMEPVRAKEISSILAISTKAELEALLETRDASDETKFRFPITRDWYPKATHPDAFKTAALSIVGEILGTHGVKVYRNWGDWREPAPETEKATVPGLLPRPVAR